MYQQEIRLILESKIINLELFSNAMYGMCKKVVKDELLTYQLVLCLVEAITNVIAHAYHRQPNHWIEIQVIVEPKLIKFEILDDGDTATVSMSKKEIDFDPEDIASLPESGRGLFLIHNFMDEVTYSKNPEGKNSFIMIKYLTS